MQIRFLGHSAFAVRAIGPSPTGSLSGSRFSAVACGALVACVLAASLGPGAAVAAITRVPTDYVSVSVAIDSTAAGDTVQIVGNGGSTFPTRLEIDKDITLQGGWRADFQVRDPDVYVTVIRDTSGTFTRPVIRITGAPRVVLDGIQIINGQQGVRADEGADLVIRDCLIRSQLNLGVADSTVSNPAGGGIRMVGGTLLMERTHIRNVATITNGAGMALVDLQYAELREVQIDNTSTSGALRDGGAIWASGVATLRLLDSTFSSCGALDDGGCLFMNGGTLEVTRCNLLDAQASSDGGAAFLEGVVSATFTDCVIERCFGRFGGAIRAEDVGSLALVRTRIARNIATTEGGGMYLERTGITFIDSEFEANLRTVSPVTIVERGGSVRAVECFGTVVGTRFADERATGRGGAWAAVGGDVEFVGCRFEGNDGGVFGGALQIELGGRLRLRDTLLHGNVANFGGGAAMSFTGVVELDHVTVVEGEARTAGAALYVDTGATAIVRNSALVRALGGDLVFCSAGNIDFANTDTWNDDTINQRGEFGGTCPDPTGTNGNVKADPLFCPPGAPDWCPMTGSPCEGSAADGGDMGWAAVCCATPAPLNLEETSWGRLKAAYRRGNR